jgi:hypothetical protein
MFSELRAPRELEICGLEMRLADVGMAEPGRSGVTRSEMHVDGRAPPASFLLDYEPTGTNTRQELAHDAIHRDKILTAVQEGQRLGRNWNAVSFRTEKRHTARYIKARRSDFRNSRYSNIALRARN